MKLEQIALNKWINPEAVSRAEFFVVSDMETKLVVDFGGTEETYTAYDEIREVAGRLGIWASIKGQVEQAALARKYRGIAP